MKELEGIVKFYLENETNNAILITGDYGIGKTYYYKNILSNQIANNNTYHDASKKYKPILVSLFGLSTLEDIQTQIFLTLYPILDNKKVKICTAIGKTLLKAIMNFKDWSNYYEIISEAGINKKDLINFSNLVICFDDLERVSTNFQIEELIGFINSLTENNNAKIIIIANENQLNREKFIHLKEKVIGNTIEFIPEIKAVFDTLVLTKYSGMPAYRNFLSANKENILKHFIPYTNNIRTLYFILTYYHNIYSYLDLNSTNHKFVKENIGEIFNLTLKFIITIAIEYKKGFLSFSKRNNIDNSNFDISDISLEKLNLRGDVKNHNKEEPSKSYKEIFLEKYYDKQQYIYFESIFSFITGGNTFDEKLFIEELKIHYNVQNDIIPSHYRVFNKLRYPEVFKLDNSEYLKLTKELLKYSDNGLFNLGDYTTVFYYIARFNNPLKFHSLENIEKRIIKGIRKGKDNYKYIPSLEMFLTANQNAKYYDNYVNITKVIFAINNEKKKNAEKIEYENLQKLLDDDFEIFKEKVMNKDFVPILNSFDPGKFYTFYIKAKLSTKWQVNSLLKYRYRQNLYQSLHDELKFLEIIHKKNKNKIKRIANSGLEFFIYDDLDNILNNTIENMINFKLTFNPDTKIPLI